MNVNTGGQNAAARWCGISLGESMDKVVYLVRYQSDDQGTMGKLLTPSGYQAAVIELPDRDNRSNISRIPAGEYRATWHHSPRFGGCYWVRDVQGRSAILTHAGNWAGDTEKGFKTHSYGCILVGSYVGKLAGQKAVLASRPALRRFFEAMNREDFMLRIMEVGNA